MSEHYADNITCPYCDYVFKESWEYDENDDEVTCESCDKDFELSVVTTVKYNTRRKDCTGDNHQWEEPFLWDTTQETCDRYNAEVFCFKSDWIPHRTWSRACKNCDEKEYVEVPIGGDCPWPQEETQQLTESKSDE